MIGYTLKYKIVKITSQDAQFTIIHTFEFGQTVVNIVSLKFTEYINCIIFGIYVIGT